MPFGPVAPWGPACPDLSASHDDEKMAPWWVGGEAEGGQGEEKEEGQALSCSLPPSTVCTKAPGKEGTELLESILALSRSLWGGSRADQAYRLL